EMHQKGGLDKCLRLNMLFSVYDRIIADLAHAIACGSPQFELFFGAARRGMR
ncbi:hypothetical protein C5S35_02635, partial [Candidatus Methanophagaceae archaeon]